MLTRRQFTSRLMAYGSMLYLSAFMVACSLWSDVLNWIPVGEAAVNSILAVLAGNGVAITPAIQQIVNLIEAGFNALTAAVKEYQSTTPPPVGALAKVQAAFKDIVDNFGTFLQSLTVPNSILGIITGLAGIVLSTIGAFVNKLPQMAGAKTAMLASSIKINGTAVPVTPHQRSTGGFRHDFNAVLDAGVKVGANVPKSAYL